MPAVTSTIVALGGVGLSAAQAIKANKDMKKAASQYGMAMNQMKQIKETNQFKGVQVPRLGFELAQQGQDQQTQQAIAALQGTGAEGIIGGIGQLVGAGNEAYLGMAAQANQAQYQRDMAQAEAGQGIEARRAEREYNIGAQDAWSASTQRAQAQENKNAAITGAFESLGAAAGGIDKMVGLYGEQKKAAATGGKALQAKSKYDIVLGEQDKNTGPAPSNYWGLSSPTNNYKPFG